MRQQIESYPALTGLRGIAAWWVVLYHFHAYLAPHLGGAAMTAVNLGYFAVDLFFVLSGFILSHVHNRDFPRLSVEGVNRFLTIRLARIYPLHLFVLLLYLSIPFAVQAFSTKQVIEERYSAISFVANLFLVQAWGFIDDYSWNIPSWSISAEWFAYLTFPLIAFGMTRLEGIGNPRYKAITAVLGFAACLGAMQAFFDALGRDTLKHSTFDFGAVRCILEFAAGCFLYKLHETRVLSPLPARIAFAVLAALFIARGAGEADYALLVAACGLLICGLTGPGLSTKILSLRPAVFLGEISYATYIIHYYVYDIFKLALVRAGETTSLALVWGTFAAILAISALLSRFIERPARRMMRALISRRRSVA